MSYRITIIGLGRTGEAIAAALKRTGVKMELVGHDKDHDAVRRAHKNGCVDRTEWNLLNACEGADLVVLAIPLAGIRDTLEAIGPELKAGCVVTDTASLKVPVLEWASQILPENIYFVGGHPILELDDSTVSAPDLLSGITYCLCPATDTPQEALQSISNLVEAVGARAYFIDAAEHDGLIAAVGQMPALTAAALQLAVGASPCSREMQQVSGVDFTASTRSLSVDPRNLAGLCLENRANITRWLDVLLTQLAGVRELVSGGESEALEEIFMRAAETHSTWTNKEVEKGKPVDYGNFSTTHMMMGDLFRNKTLSLEEDRSKETRPGSGSSKGKDEQAS
jgi:prephenate dehydrogenase